jgi:hypothetical protein
MFQLGKAVRLLSPLLAFAGAVAPGSGHAQGVPVVDASAIAAAQQNLQMLQQQLQQLQNLANTAQGLAKAVGQNGALSVVLPQVLSQSGLDQFSATVSSTLSGLNAGSQLQSVFNQIKQQKGLAGAAGQIADFSSFSSAQQWVNATLTTSPGATATAQGLGRQARSLVAGETAADGYALALTARQQASTISTQTQSLANQVAAAQTLREDVAANTAVMLAVHDEMAEIQALLASLLAVQSSGQMADSDMQTTSVQSPTSQTSSGTP